MTKNVWRFIICGSEESAVHGKRLRRTIKENADKNKILGSVRNIKFKSHVEVRVIAETIEEAKDLKRIITTELGEKGEYTFGEVFVVDGEETDSYREFEVIREDELTEMVWALQGAGDAFVESTKQQKKILETINQRDYKKEYGQLAALLIEVGRWEMEINSDIDNGKLTPDLPINCLKEALIRPPYLNDEFISRTHELFYFLGSINDREMQDMSDANKEKHFRKLLDSDIEKYKGIISRRIEEIDSIIKIKTEKK